jgi:hypothetical protein
MTVLSKGAEVRQWTGELAKKVVGWKTDSLGAGASAPAGPDPDRLPGDPSGTDESCAEGE